MARRRRRRTTIAIRPTIKPDRVLAALRVIGTSGPAPGRFRARTAGCCQPSAAKVRTPGTPIKQSGWLRRPSAGNASRGGTRPGESRRSRTVDGWLAQLPPSSRSASPATTRRPPASGIAACVPGARLGGSPGDCGRYVRRRGTTGRRGGGVVARAGATGAASQARVTGARRRGRAAARAFGRGSRP